MKNNLAIVTGSTSGIGYGIAEKLASKGYNIALNGFGDINEIVILQNQLEQKYNITCKYFPADLSKAEEIEKFIHDAAQSFNCNPAVLVNNAGMQFVSPVEDFPSEKWENIIKLNLSASFYTIKAVIPYMKKQKFGRILNMASAHGLIASPFKSAYVAAKHGLIGLTKSVALETAKEGITVNAICPGYVKTPLVLNQITATAKARNMTEEDVINNVMLGPQATKQFIEIQEVADLVAFLCSPDAKSITGSAYAIDGGWTAQ